MTLAPSASRFSVGPILVCGFVTAVGMWVVWFLTHLPAIRLTPAVSGFILLTAQFWGCFLGAKVAGSRRALPTGLGGGLVSSAVNLLALGSRLVEAQGATPPQGLDGLQPSVILMALGYLGVGALLGLIAGVLARSASSAATTDEPGRWLARFAIVTAAAAAPLLLLGGLVTSTKSALAVPDWPGTYGANMFLFPIALMSEPRIYLEHTHRLFGTLVGLSMIVLTVWCAVADRRKGVKFAAAGLLVLVIAQGLLGGYGVTLRMKPETYKAGQYLATVHGVAAHAFFAGLVALAVVLAPSYQALTERLPLINRPRMFALLLVIAIFIQLAFGALFRHLRSMHSLWSHAAFSLAVVVLAMLVSFMLPRYLKEARAPVAPRLARTGKGLLHSVGLQFLLGWVTFYFVLAGPEQPSTPVNPPLPEQLAEAPPINVLESLIRTAHQANGAFLLALAVICLTWCNRLRARPAAPAL